MKNESVLVAAIGAGVLGLISLINSVLSRKRVNKMCEHLDVAIDNFEDQDWDIDISDKLIEDITKKKVSEAVERRMKTAVELGAISAKNSFEQAIKKEINAQYNDIRSEVKRAVKEKVGDIDIYEVKREVIEEAKEEAKEKFRNDLDNVLDEFNDQLHDVRKIYSSIAKKMEEK